MSANEFLNLARAGMEKAGAQGVESAESYLSHSREIEIEVRDGRIETIKSAEERGLGLRVFREKRIGFAYTTDLSPGGLDRLARDAAANASQTAEDRFHRLPKPSASYPELELFDPAIPQTAIEAKVELARRMEKAARAYDPRIKIIESATYQDGEVEVGLVNTEGLASHYRAAICGLYISLTAQDGDGDSQTGFAMDFRRRLGELAPEAVGREAAERAVRMLGARTPGGGEVPAVLDPFVVVSLLGVLAPSLTGEAVQKGRSLFAGRIGQPVASSLVTVVDDGAHPSGIRSAPCDGEGVPTGRTVLIENGVLKGFLHNTYTAAKDGSARSTGNGVRGSFKGTPEVGTTNFFLQPGDADPQEIVADTPRGFYVTEVMGMHTANPISGDFSVGASGLWIEDGRLAYPVRGAAIAGNIRDLLAAIDAVGRDLRFFGGTGAPTVRVSKLAVSGS
ncbi:MAG: TldD/PmbA family protein [Thermoanaerobacterales bacterium]|nr:TldD/PmbA family protein [Thermoanaerobacterales bacterium]